MHRRGSSSRDLPEEILEMPGTSKSRSSGSLGQRAAWRTIAKAYAADYVALFALASITIWCETAAPFAKVIYSASDQEYWRYSYPLHQKNTVPAWMVPLIATAVPLLVILAIATLHRLPRLESHNVVLGLFSSVLITACITNLVKLGVGRPRPNFAARCWPNGQPMKFGGEGVPVCAADAIDPGEGRKSFPSGHTSWSTSGMAYLSFWLAGHLRCFDGSGHPLRLVVAGLPIAISAWIGITRLQDYWHHVEDVAAGFLLGLGFAYLSYRMHYPPLMSSRLGEPLVEDGDVTAGENQRSFQDLEAAMGLAPSSSGR